MSRDGTLCSNVRISRDIRSIERQSARVHVVRLVTGGDLGSPYFEATKPYRPVSSVLPQYFGEVFNPSEPDFLVLGRAKQCHRNP